MGASNFWRGVYAFLAQSKRHVDQFLCRAFKIFNRLLCVPFHILTPSWSLERAARALAPELPFPIGVVYSPQRGHNAHADPMRRAS
jgi:hypothetical protein